MTDNDLKARVTWQIARRWHIDPSDCHPVFNMSLSVAMHQGVLYFFNSEGHIEYYQ